MINIRNAYIIIYITICSIKNISSRHWRYNIIDVIAFIIRPHSFREQFLLFFIHITIIIIIIIIYITIILFIMYIKHSENVVIAVGVGAYWIRVVPLAEH